MDTKQIAVILLIIAIVLSAATIVVSLGADTDYTAPNCAELVECVDTPDDSGATIGFTILPPPENAS